MERCESSKVTLDRMVGRAEAPSPELIADAFVLQIALAGKSAALTRFWVETDGASGDLDDLIAQWLPGTADHDVVAGQRSLLDTLRSARAFIVAFEGPPPAAEEVAKRFAAKATAAGGMSPETYRAEFVELADGFVRAEGVPPYAATLMAAQAIRNRLDEQRGVAPGALLPPDDPAVLQLWDRMVRQAPLRSEADRISTLPGGEFVIRNFLISRQTVIGCAAAAMATGKAPLLPPPPVRIPGFTTAGYSSPGFLDAVYQGQIKDIELTSVGVYLTAFTGMFTRSDIAECQRVISPATVGRIAAAGSMDMIGKIFGGLGEAHNRGGGRDDQFGHGAEAGAETIGGMAMDEMGAKTDAKLFYKRHGCASPEARRFFEQVTELARQG